MKAAEPPAIDDNKLIAERRAKLAGLRRLGGAFPNDFRRDTLAAQLQMGFGEKSAGRVPPATGWRRDASLIK